MKLNSILETKRLRQLYGRERLNQYKNELALVMPKHKSQHSLRVGDTLAKLGVPSEVVSAGLFHDYSERGGDPQRLARDLGLNQRSAELVSYLTNPDKEGGGNTLGHIKQIFGLIADPKTKNHLVLAKLADRLDNLHKRRRSDRLSAGYLRKSKQLVGWLLDQYTGSAIHRDILIAKLHRAGLEV